MTLVFQVFLDIIQVKEVNLEQIFESWFKQKVAELFEVRKKQREFYEFSAFFIYHLYLSCFDFKVSCSCNNSLNTERFIISVSERDKILLINEVVLNAPWKFIVIVYER